MKTCTFKTKFYLQARENLNSLKQERDQTRNTIDKMRRESGLLAEPDLLRDMESSLIELKAIKTELECLKADNKIKTQQIRNIRKNIELISEEMVRSKTQVLVEKKKSNPKVMRGRPSILKPTLPPDAFQHLLGKRPKKLQQKSSMFML